MEKVIFVIPNLSFGGAERVISLLTNSFIDYGINVDVVLLHDSTVTYSISEKANIVYFGLDLLSINKYKSCLILREYFKNQKIKYKKMVIIPFLDTCLKRILISTLGLNIPVVACERNDPYQKGIGIVNKIKANIPYYLSDYCIFQTADAKKYYWKCVQKKSDVIFNPLVFEAGTWRGQNAKRIISVGRLEEQKNHHLLINAFSEFHDHYPEYVLEIYGEGSLKEELSKQIEKLSLSEYIHLMGFTSNIYEILSESKMFILSSNYEGMSNALIEALATGMPVITTDHPCGGARMLVDNKVNGLLVPTNNINELVVAMKQIASDDSFACSIGCEAKKIREKLAIDRITELWINIIVNL